MAKKNYLKVPHDVIEKIILFDQDDVVVACAKMIKREDIPNYRKLGIEFNGDDLVLPEAQLPPASAGRKRYRTTRALASWNNLTEDRVRYICSLHNKIYLSTGQQEDRWAIIGRGDR